MGQGWYGAIGKLAVAALLIGAVLIWRAEAWLYVDVPLEHADVIVVLGGESGQRVIGAADRNVRGTFYVFGSHMLTLDHGALPYAQVRSWFFPPEADGEFVTGHGPGPTYTLDFLDQMPLPGEAAGKGHACYAEGRVVYLSVDGTQGHAIVQGTVLHELTFTYTGGTVSALTCTCYETGLCKHSAALLLQLRETVDFLREEHEEAFAASDRFAAVSKRVFSHFAMDGSTGTCITLT